MRGLPEAIDPELVDARPAADHVGGGVEMGARMRVHREELLREAVLLDRAGLVDPRSLGPRVGGHIPREAMAQVEYPHSPIDTFFPVAVFRSKDRAAPDAS
jgi:hypothetical protein